MLPEDHPDMAVSLRNLARLQEGLQRYAEALKLVMEAHAIWLAAGGPDDVDTREAASKIERLGQFTTGSGTNKPSSGCLLS